MPPRESEVRVRDEVSLIFRTSTEEIRFQKRQQAVATSYGLVLLAAIAAAGLVLAGYGLLSPAWKLGLVLLAIVTAAAAAHAVDDLQAAVWENRRRLRRAREYFGEDFRVVLGEVREGHAKWSEPGTTSLQLLALSVGLVVSLAILIYSPSVL